MRARTGLMLLPLIAALAPYPASAQTWVNIGKNTSGSVYDVDWDSIRRDGQTVTFTLRTQYGEQAKPDEADGYVALRKANCGNRTYNDLHTDYMKAGAVFKTSGEEEVHTANPDTIAAAVLDKVCAP